MNDWEDRAVDAALQELHGGQPPDLSARVVLALQEAPAGRLPVVRRSPAARRRKVFAAAAALLLVALAVATLGRRAAPEASDQVVARLEVDVLAGTIECVEVEQGRVVATARAAGSQGSFAARAGNRMRCAAECLLQIGPFGVLAVGPATELEVMSMEFSWKHGVVAASSLTLAVVAGVVTWHTLARTETAVAGEVMRLQADPDRGQGAASLAAENELLRRRVQQLEEQNAALQLQPSRDAAPPAPVEPPPPAPPVAEARPAVVFDDEAYAAALAAIDWQLVGSVTNEMGPMLVELLKAVEAGEEVPPELAVKIQELNTKLVAQVPLMLKAGLPGFGPNGAYTHPLVVANTLASTLAAAGQPLTDAQRAQVGGLVRAFAAESKSIVDTPHEFELEHLLAEIEMKDRFYREVASQLAPEQSQTMYPKGATDYDGASLFGTGLMTRPYTEAVTASSPAEFARIASNKLGDQIGFDEATTTKVRAVVERMMTASPELWRDPPTSTESNLRMLKAGRTPAALRRQIEVMREIQRQVPLTPAQKQKLASMKHILVPLPR